MRISDWSSDVCSSDLLLKRDGHGERITLRIQDHAVVSRDSNVGRNTGTTRPLSCSIMADCSCMPMRTWSSVQSIRLLWKYGPSSSRMTATTYGVLPRSEEHTSELQSLMRISYAVFCLKKKKNKQLAHTRMTS